MAHHHEEDLNLTPEQKKFNDLIKHGDDFAKIEIFRLAVETYQEALAMGVDDKLAKSKLAYCKHKLSFEKRVFTYIAIVAVIIVGFVWAIRC